MLIIKHDPTRRIEEGQYFVELINLDPTDSNHFIGFLFFLILYLLFAVSETKTIQLTFIEVGDVIFEAIFWFISAPFILNGIRTVEKRR